MKNIRIYGDNYLDLLRWLLYRHVLSKIPYSPGDNIRYTILRNMFKHFGANSIVSRDVNIVYPSGIEIDEYVNITGLGTKLPYILRYLHQLNEKSYNNLA